MQQTPFHMYYKARMLDSLSGENALVSAYASANIKVYPYQIAAAQFALRSPYLKGCILCDEGSLGKTYEALLIATQKWYEGKDKILVVLPVNMLAQWTQKIENSFTIPYMIIDNAEALNAAEDDNPFEQSAMVITTYNFAAENAEKFKDQNWDLIIFDEADCLNKTYKEDSKTARSLKDMAGDAFKLLLTPTPIEMDIRDIYGLIYFIDETVLPPDVDEFYQYYFRRPDRYPELAEWVSKFCFRTLKSQVTDYVNFTKRIPNTVYCEFTKDEKVLYDKMNAYILRPEKIAYPNQSSRDLNNMTIQWNHILSSSPQAITNTISGAVKKLRQTEVLESKKELFAEEIRALTELEQLAKSLDTNGKMKMLLSVLKKSFSGLRKSKAPQKALIFVDNLTTLKRLDRLLFEAGYSLLTYSGTNSRDYSIMERFRTDETVQLLIATDDMAKGLDIEFCPLVVNYDMLSNATQMEQRISRCHRQGQTSDVIVINLIAKDNYADVRYVQLINKRVLQFDGIFGLSDHILGNFDANIGEVLAELRPTKEVLADFESNLSEHENENREVIENAENTLFTTFTKEIADKVAVTPQYIAEESEAVNNQLWEVVTAFFEEYNRTHTECYFEIDEQAQTIMARDYEQLPCLFYYNTGSRNKPYTSLCAYGMAKDFKPHHGRITLSSVIGRGIINAITSADTGTVTVDAEIEPCTIALYHVDIRSQKPGVRYTTIEQEYPILVGKTESGKQLSDEDCQRILELPVLKYTESEHKTEHWLKGTGSRPHELDRLVPVNELKQDWIDTNYAAQAEEIQNMRHKATIAKAQLSHGLKERQAHISELEKQAENTIQRMERLKMEKELKILWKEVLQKEETLFMEEIRLDTELEQGIEQFLKNSHLKGTATREFLIQVTGNK